MSMAWIRRIYGVPAKRGGRVVFDGHPGCILSATHHLHLRLNDGRKVWVHPKWRMEYVEVGEAP